MVTCRCTSKTHMTAFYIMLADCTIKAMFILHAFIVQATFNTAKKVCIVLTQIFE